MKTKAIIRVSPFVKVNKGTKANVSVRLTALGRRADNSSYQINQMAATPIETFAKYWNAKSGRNMLVQPKATRGRPSISDKLLQDTEELNKELLKINKEIDDLCQYIGDEFIKTPNNQIPTGWLKETIDKFFNPQNYGLTKKRPTTLFEYLDEFIDKVPQRKDNSTGRLVAKDVLSKYKLTRDKLKSFAIYDRKSDYLFEDIDMKFYDRYVNYLSTKGYSANTIGRFIKELKVVLGQATKDGINKSIAYKDFVVLTEEIDNVYLNETELQLIKDADLNKTPKQIIEVMKAQADKFEMELGDKDDNWNVYPATLDKVRSYFLLLAWTGSRFSDLSKITASDISDEFITFRQKKTNTKVIIPIHPVVKEIFEKYDYNISSTMSNQKFNDYLKLVCMLAGIDAPTTITRTEGGVRQTRTLPKWKLVSSHTGRRSFCTNMYLRGINTLMIMCVSGHKTEKSFLKYIKADNEHRARLLAEQWAKMYY